MPLIYQPPRFSRRPNVYTTAERLHRPRQIDPYMFPTGGLAGIAGAGAAPTGIAVVDQFIADANAKTDRLVIATEIGTVCSVIGAVAGLLMIFRGGRR